MNRQHFVVSALGCFFVLAMVAVFPAPQMTANAAAPTTGPASSQPVANVRQVELTLLGPIGEIKGISWPNNPNARPAFALSAWVEEPCDLTIHLPGGKTIKMRTQSILIISRLWAREDAYDLVEEIAVSPEAKDGSGADKARDVEKLLADWGAVPNDHMLAVLTEFKNEPDPAVGSEGGAPSLWKEGVGRASLGDGSDSSFVFWHNPTGKWSIVAHVSATPAACETARHDAKRRRVPIIEPSTRPIVEP